MVIALKRFQSLDNCLTLAGISWEKLGQIEATFADVAGVRFVYCDGVLEIMIVGAEHEYYKRTISLLLEAYCRVKGIRFYSGGSATLGGPAIVGRKEPDESYSFGSQKEVPDLAIEVIVTSGKVNQILEIYRRLGVPEVWFYGAGELKVYTLQDNQYIRADHSCLLPDLNLDLLSQYISYPDQYDAVTAFINTIGHRDS